MSKQILLTLDNIIILDNLKIIKRSQNKSIRDCNYYFTPNLTIPISDAKVLITNEKFLVFEFDKKKHLNLFNLLKNINEKLKYKLKNNYNELYHLNDNEFHNLFSDLVNTFTIRCHLQNKNGIYYIKSKSSFKLPNINHIYDNILLEIKNVWSHNSKYGFNIELK